MDKVTRSILIIVGTVALAGGIAASSFFGGAAWQRGQDTTTISANTAYGQNSTNGNSGPGAGSGNGRPGPGGAGRQGFRPGGMPGGTAGTIQSISGNTITVKLDNGTVETVTMTADTIIAKSQTAASADLAAGQTVQVAGLPADNGASDGSGGITARQITIKQ